MTPTSSILPPSQTAHCRERNSSVLLSWVSPVPCEGASTLLQTAEGQERGAGKAGAQGQPGEAAPPDELQWDHGSWEVVGAAGGAESRVLSGTGGTPSDLTGAHPSPQHCSKTSTSPAADKCPLHLLKGLESDPAPMDMHKLSKTSNKIDKAQCFPVLPKKVSTPSSSDRTLHTFKKL